MRHQLPGSHCRDLTDGEKAIKIQNALIKCDMLHMYPCEEVEVWAGIL